MALFVSISSYKMEDVENLTSLENNIFNQSGDASNSTAKEIYCTEWPGASLPYFHAANVFHLGAFVVPHNFKASALLMRSTLCLGQIMFMLWAALNICAADIFTWNLALTVINMTHVIYLTVHIWPPMIPESLKELYTKLFIPLKVNRRQFRSLTREAEVKWLEPGDYYAIEESTPSNQRLSILLQGKIRVTCDSTYLHFVFPNQFLDSAEWESAENGNIDHSFQVSLVAEERSQYITWSRTQLKQLLEAKPFLEAIIRCLIGKDITTKLYSLNEYKSEKPKPPDKSRLNELMNENLMQRSRSADALHMGSKGFVRSDVWMTHKLNPDRSLAGVIQTPRRSQNSPNLHPKGIK